jgi:hypothetical protein
MAILWQIHFGDARIGIGERADTLDDVESNFRNVLRAQPFQNRAALKCNG